MLCRVRDLRERGSMRSFCGPRRPGRERRTAATPCEPSCEWIGRAGDRRPAYLGDPSSAAAASKTGRSGATRSTMAVTPVTRCRRAGRIGVSAFMASNIPSSRAERGRRPVRLGRTSPAGVLPLCPKVKYSVCTATPASPAAFGALALGRLGRRSDNTERQFGCPRPERYRSATWCATGEPDAPSTGARKRQNGQADHHGDTLDDPGQQRSIEVGLWRGQRGELICAGDAGNAPLAAD